MTSTAPNTTTNNNDATSNSSGVAVAVAVAVLAVLVVAGIVVYCGCCRRQTGDGARPPAPHVVQNGMFSLAAAAPAPAAQQDEAGYQLPNARQSEMYDNPKLDDDQSWLAGAGASAEYAVVVDSGVDTAGYQVPSAEQEQLYLEGKVAGAHYAVVASNTEA